MKKLCNIVMLPTEVGVFYEIKTKPDYPKQTLYSELTFKCPYEDNALSVRFDRHLYITSDEEIKEGDKILYLIHQREPKHLMVYLLLLSIIQIFIYINQIAKR